MTTPPDFGSCRPPRTHLGDAHATRKIRCRSESSTARTRIDNVEAALERLLRISRFVLALERLLRISRFVRALERLFRNSRFVRASSPHATR